MPRPQFTLRALLVAMLVVASFFAGAAWQNTRKSRSAHGRFQTDYVVPGNPPRTHSTLTEIP